MDKKTLLIFAKRIFNSGSREKAVLSLRELKRLLIVQGAPETYVTLIEEMVDSAQEMQTIANKPVLTEQDVQIAHARTLDRRRREEEARHYGRC